MNKKIKSLSRLFNRNKYIDIDDLTIETIGKSFNIKRAVWCTKLPNRWSDVAFKGSRKLEYKNMRWSKSKYLDLPNDPTWSDIWKAIDQSIELSKSWDHIFIENVIENKNIIHIHMGS